MIRSFLAITALVALTACGDGNPFTDGDAGDDDAANAAIPEDIAGTFQAFSYDPANGTLTITGLSRDEDVGAVSYVRKPALDEGVYRAYTAQDDPLDEHTTVYVREHGDVSGAVALTGGQFTYFSAGVNFKRDGRYDPHPVDASDDTGLVTYTGEYIGLSDVNGPDTDLLPVPGGAGSGSIIPAQASVVRGRIFINIGFASNNVAGTINERQITLDSGTFDLPDIQLEPTNLTTDGTFDGNAVTTNTGSRTNVGSYAGILGGPDSNVLAGGVYLKDHFEPVLSVEDEEEYGVFVLGKCGGALEDPSPECDAVDD